MNSLGVQLGITDPPEWVRDGAEAQVKPLMCRRMSYYDLAFHSLASGRATMERHDLNLSVRGFWQEPGLKANRFDGFEGTYEEAKTPYTRRHRPQGGAIHKCRHCRLSTCFQL